MRSAIVFATVALAALMPAVVADTSVKGDYLEVRTADVFVGPCIANGEVNLTGKEAILAWQVREGGWQGVSLEGLSVVAIVQSEATLGDPFGLKKQEARSIIVVDDSASEVQKESLVSLARSLAPSLLERVVRVESAPVDLTLGHQLQASVRVGDMASFSTRAFKKGDHLCGNETLLYPPLAEANAQPAFTVEHEFHGQGLGSQWSSPHRSSAFVGEFSR